MELNKVKIYTEGIKIIDAKSTSRSLGANMLLGSIDRDLTCRVTMSVFIPYSDGENPQYVVIHHDHNEIVLHDHDNVMLEGDGIYHCRFSDGYFSVMRHTKNDFSSVALFH